MEPVLTLGERLHVARRRAGISVEGMADLMVCSRQTIYNYESGATVPNKGIIFLWSEETGLDFAWLLQGLEIVPESGPDLHGPTSACKSIIDLRDDTSVICLDENSFINPGDEPILAESPNLYGVRGAV